MFLKKCIFLLLFIWAYLPCHAQLTGKALIDSMIKALPGHKEDTNKVNLLDAIAQAYRNFNPDKGLKYAEKEMALATRLNWQMGVAYAHMSFGLNHLNKSEHATALDHYNKSLLLFRAIKYPRGEATILGK